MNVVVMQGFKKDHVIPLGESLSIGRDPSNQLVLLDPRISRVHARIEKQEDKYLIQDLDSSNGIYVNGKLVAQSVLKEGDEIVIGDTHMKLVAEGTPLDTISREEVAIVVEEVPHTQITSSVDYKRSTFLDVEGRGLKLDQFKKTAKNLSILYKSGNVFNSILDEEGLILKIVDMVMEVIKADRYVVLFRDAKTKEFVPRVVRRGEERGGYFPIAISRSIVETVLKEHVGVICANTGMDARFKDAESFYAYGIKSAMCVPIAVKDQILGLVYCDSLIRMNQFEEDDLKLLTAISSQAAIALENARLYREIGDQERLKHELQIAHEIQQILLPRTFPTLDGFDLSFKSLSAQEVGGDYYDWFWVSPDKLALVIADVSGKGVPGALVMAVFRSTLKSRALGALSTSALLREVNNLLIPDIKQDMFISAILAFLDTKQKTLTFSRAGHLPLIVFRALDVQLHEFSPKGVALGFSKWSDLESPQEQTIDLKKGDQIIFYTDGVEEAQDMFHQPYGKERFLETLKNVIALSGNQKAQTMIEQILAKITDHAKDQPQADDITLGLLKVESF